MAAFLTYVMSSAAQANLAGLGFAAIPDAVVTYSVQRALPMLSTDTRQGTWYFEPSAGIKYTGADNNVFSAAKDSYTHSVAVQLMLTSEAASNSSLASGGLSGSINVSALNLTASQLSGVSDPGPPEGDSCKCASAACCPPLCCRTLNPLTLALPNRTQVTSLQSQVANNNSQISILTSVAIAALVFGIAGLALAMFATIRLVVVGAHGAGNQQGIYPGGISGSAGSESRTHSVKGAKFSSGGDSGGGTGRESVSTMA